MEASKRSLKPWLVGLFRHSLLISSPFTDRYCNGCQNEESKAMYQKLFEQYDMDRDGFITMDENLEQDKVMADDQGKPFDEVLLRSCQRSLGPIC